MTTRSVLLLLLVLTALLAVCFAAIRENSGVTPVVAPTPSPAQKHEDTVFQGVVDAAAAVEAEQIDAAVQEHRATVTTTEKKQEERVRELTKDEVALNKFLKERGLAIRGGK